MSSDRSARAVFVLAAVLLAAAAAVALAWGGLGRGGEAPPTAGPTAGAAAAGAAPGAPGSPGDPAPRGTGEPGNEEADRAGAVGGTGVREGGAEGAPAGEDGPGVGGRPALGDGAAAPEAERRGDASERPSVGEGGEEAATRAGGSGDDATAPAAPAARDPRVDRILARAESAYASLRSLRANFEQEVHVPLLERRRHGTGIWYQKGRSRFKMEFEEPPEDVIVADGVHLWLYYPSTNPKQVIRRSLEAETTSAGTADVLARILSEARTGYAATYGAEETVAGVQTHRIDLRPLGRSPYRRVRVWIAQADHLVRRFEIVEENETVRTVTLRDLEPNAPIPDDTFHFRPPADADVFAG